MKIKNEKELSSHAASNLSSDLRRRRMKMFINQRVITYAAIGLCDVKTFQGLESQPAQLRELTAAVN
jgi:hypothetical protein